MQERYLKNVIEAALLAAGRPLSVAELVEMFDAREQPEAGEVRAVLEELESDYTDRGIELKEVASGFRIQIRHTISEAVSRLWQERPQRYSRALLETLALIAYRQPITRAEIEEVRGVTVNPNIVRTLFERNWIRVVGHREVPGHPELLGTTREFLDYFNLKNLDDLPSLAELRDMQVIMSNSPGEAAASSSAELSRYSSCTPFSSACSSATCKAACAMSIPRTRAPWRAMASASMPPPQPTSRTRAPASEARSSMKASRSGLSSCSGRNSPAGSHQRCARASNLAISPASTLGGDCIVADIPQAGRSTWEPMRSFQRVV